MMAGRTRRVALIYDAKLPYDLKVISGIARYAQEGADLKPTQFPSKQLQPAVRASFVRETTS
jgi:hypothetical protein